MKRTILTQLLTLLLSMVGINAWADNSGLCGDGVTWTLSNDTLIISYSGNGTGKMDDFIHSYNPWISYKDSIKYVVIEDGVSSICRHAFDNFGAITSVTIASSVMEIEDDAFLNCSGLTNVSIPDGVTKIGFGAFTWCSSLTSINIPSSVISIGNNPFSNCSALTSIIVNTENTVYDSRDNCNAIIEKSSNNLIVGCKESTIPNSVISIGLGAFTGCSSLTSVAIPNSVKSIDDEAFFGCSALTSVTIPNSVESIGYSAFEGCSCLASLSLPHSVTKIGGSAFSGCSALTSVTIPNSVTEIGDFVFSGCSALASIIVQDGNEKYDSRNGCYAIIETATNTIISGCKNTFIPNSVTSIGWYAFSGCTGLYSITIPNNVTSIGEGAFSGCYGLTSVSIPANLTSIKRNTFRYCSALTSIAIPNSVTSIGDDAFTGCSGLTSVTIGKSVTEIHNSAFSACYSLTSICSLIKNPMNIKSSVFSNRIYDTCTLYVPEGTVDKYRECTGWKEFWNIKEGSPTGISTIKMKKATEPKYYTIDGRRISKPQKGLNIINGKKVIVK